MNLQEQYQKETGKKCAIPDHNGSKTIPTWEYVRWLEAKAAKPEVSEEAQKESRIYIVFDDDDVVVKAFEGREECIDFCKKHDYGWKAAPMQKQSEREQTLRKAVNAILAQTKGLSAEQRQELMKGLG